jgi:hypothetical protein
VLSHPHCKILLIYPFGPIPSMHITTKQTYLSSDQPHACNLSAGAT